MMRENMGMNGQSDPLGNSTAPSGACTSIGCAKDRMQRSALRYELDRCTETITRLQQERDAARAGLRAADKSAAREHARRIDTMLTGQGGHPVDECNANCDRNHDERDKTRYQIEELRLLKRDAEMRGFKAGRAHAIARIAIAVSSEPGSHFSPLRAAAHLENLVGHKDSSQDFDQ